MKMPLVGRWRETLPIQIYGAPGGLRVKVLGRRIHHGLVGLVLVGYGAYLAMGDADDFPWLSD